MALTNVAKTTLSRVFMTESKSSPAVQPVFQDCMIIGSVSRDYGDREPVYCQSPYEIGKFRQIDVIESPPSNVESSLGGRFSRDTKSTLISVAEAGAPFDIHAHIFAKGENPSVFNDWRQKIVFEGVRPSSLNIDELGSHDEDQVVGQGIDFAADAWFQLVPLTFTERAASVVDSEMLGAWIHYNGKLERKPRESVMMFATSVGAGGSPSTPPDIVYSIDQGSNWYAMDVNSATSSDTGDAVAVVGQYLVVCSKSSDSIHYALLADFDGVTVPSFSEVTTGFGASAGPTDIDVAGSVAFMSAEGGYVYTTSYPPNGVTALTSGGVTSENLNAISAFDENTIVAVGANNTVIVSLDGTNFAAVNGPEASAALTSVAALSADIYIVGTGAGKMWYTVDGGITWTQKSFPSSGSGSVEDIRFATGLVGFASHTLSGAGRILMTTDAGYSWVVVPSSGLASYSDKFNEIATLARDPNLVLAVGLAEDGSDGVIIVGEPS